MNPAEQKAYYAKNKAAGDAASKAYEQRLVDKYKRENAESGAAAIRGMEEGRMDQMGNSYKKGGKVMKMVKEKMEPMSGPNMVRHDDFISQHEVEGHKHHKNEFKKHASGHMHHMDHVQAMCGGGYAKSKKMKSGGMC